MAVALAVGSGSASDSGGGGRSTTVVVVVALNVEAVSAIAATVHQHSAEPQIQVIVASRPGMPSNPTQQHDQIAEMLPRRGGLGQHGLGLHKCAWLWGLGSNVGEPCLTSIRQCEDTLLSSVSFAFCQPTRLLAKKTLNLAGNSAVPEARLLSAMGACPHGLDLGPPTPSVRNPGIDVLSNRHLDKLLLSILLRIPTAILVNLHVNLPVRMSEATRDSKKPGKTCNT